MFQMLSVAVVIPAFNESRLLPITLDKIPQIVDRIFVVDDGSTDTTHQVVNALTDHRIRVISHGENLGVGRAIASGYQASLNEGYDLVLVMGADDQMDSREIPALLRPIAEGQADYVKGNRLGHPDHKKRMPRVRRLGTYYLAYLTRLATGLPALQDSQCGFTAISRQVLFTLPLDELFPRYGYPNDLLSMIAVRKYRVLDAVVTPIYGTENSGLQIHRVLLPLSGILLKAVWRRMAASFRDLHRYSHSSRVNGTKSSQ